jgi:hypothetical protein
LDFFQILRERYRPSVGGKGVAARESNHKTRRKGINYPLATSSITKSFVIVNSTLNDEGFVIEGLQPPKATCKVEEGDLGDVAAVFSFWYPTICTGTLRGICSFAIIPSINYGEACHENCREELDGCVHHGRCLSLLFLTRTRKRRISSSSGKE